MTKVIAQLSLLVIMAVIVTVVAENAKYPVADVGCKRIKTHRYDVIRV